MLNRHVPSSWKRGVGAGMPCAAPVRFRTQIPAGAMLRCQRDHPTVFRTLRAFLGPVLAMGCTPLLLALLAAIGMPTKSFAQSGGAQSTDGNSAAASAAVIRPGDGLQITVWRRPELSGEFFVANDGSIAHPFYQEVSVGGVSIDVAAQRVQAFLELYETNPRVRVDPLFRVNVGGHVRMPRLYTLRPEYTIFDAINEAGGPTEQGRLSRVRLYRQGQVHTLDLSGANPSAAEMRIQSGDRIVVERSTNVFRDIIRPTISFAGSVASLYFVWDRRIRRR